MHRFASIILVDRLGRILLQERDEHPVIDPEKWGFVGGSVEDGEEFEPAAYRELEEETGIHLDGGLSLFREFTVFHHHSGTDDLVQLFVMPTELTDTDIVCGEGRQIVFVEPDVARALDLTASATIAIPGFLDSDVYRSMTA